MIFSYLSNFVSDQRTVDYANTLLSVIKNEQNKNNDYTQEAIRSWADDVRNKKEMNPCDSLIIKSFDRVGHLTNYLVASASGEIICSKTAATQKISILDRDYFQETLAYKNLAISGATTGRISGKKMIAYSYPILNNDREVAMVLVIGIDLEWANQYISQINLPNGSTLIVTDNKGLVEISYPKNPKLIGAYGISPEILSIFLAQKSGVLEEKGDDGIKRMYIYSSFATSDGPSLFQIIGIPKSNQFSFAGFSNQAIVVALIIALIIHLTIYWFLSRRKSYSKMKR